MATRVRFKAEHIWQAPDDDKRYEVIDGELFVSPAPSLRHQRAVANLLLMIANWIRPRQLGEILPAPLGVVLDPETGVEPDLVYVSREHQALFSERGVEGPPDLVVEVLSPSTQARDRGIKMARYERAGIPHYWLLDTDAHTLEPYRLGEDGYKSLGTFAAGSVFRPELFPGLEIPIDDLWD